MQDIIPKHIIEIFKKTFDEYPSITKFKIDKQDVLNKMFLKSKIIWYEDKFNMDGGINNTKILYEYDSSGILVFIKKIKKSDYPLKDEELKKSYMVFILSKINKKNMVEFTLQKSLNRPA